MDLRFYPRDLAGYGPEPPHAAWPGDARVAVQFVVNYEEGAERSLLHGDAESEAFLSDIVGAAPLPGVRHMNMESLYDYGARAGFWRLMRLFGDRSLPFTCFAVGMALARNPAAARAMAEAGHEVASHGWRWIDYQYVDEATEREHIARAYDTIAELTGDAAGRHVSGPHLAQHAAADAGAWRLRLFRRQLRRRSAVLGDDARPGRS